MSGARDLPADLIERAAEAVRRYEDEAHANFATTPDGYARAVLAAVADHWPTPTTHRDQLAEALWLNVCGGDPTWAFSDLAADDRDAHLAQADAILAAGVLRDAAHVETEARAQAGEDIARALETSAEEIPKSRRVHYEYVRWAERRRAARIARDTTAGTT